MSATSALTLGDRVRPRDIEKISLFKRPALVGKITGRCASDGAYVVTFYALSNGNEASSALFYAHELQRMPTPGDTIETIDGRLGKMIAIAYYDPDTRDDMSYAVRLAGENSDKLLPAASFRVLEERTVDAEIVAGWWRIWRRWRGIDHTYKIARLRHRPSGWTLRIEWKPADLWVGAFTAPKDRRRHWWLACMTLVAHIWRDRAD